MDTAGTLTFEQLSDSVTFWIAVLGFLLSLIQLIYSVAVNRESYLVHVIDYKKPRSDTVQFFLCIENRSASPLTITDISFCGIHCELLQKPISGTPGNWDYRQTDNFPLCIPSHSSRCSFVEFLDVSGGSFPGTPLDPGKTVILEIRSTRLLARKKLLLGCISHYLHTMKQHRSALEVRNKDPHL